MENERVELQIVAIPLKWQLPAPKCCILQGKCTEEQIKTKIPERKKHNSQNNSGPFYYSTPPASSVVHFTLTTVATLHTLFGNATLHTVFGKDTKSVDALRDLFLDFLESWPH
jgi:hypothetical protein